MIMWPLREPMRAIQWGMSFGVSVEAIVLRGDVAGMGVCDRSEWWTWWLVWMHSRWAVCRMGHQWVNQRSSCGQTCRVKPVLGMVVVVAWL